jgi:protein gp37
MASNSSISWTNHTFNPWWGCVKVSPACDRCYAEAWAKRVGQGVWGVAAPRRFFGNSHWKEPVKWNSHAENQGKRARVFCASMADVFERRTELNPHRERLWELIRNTPWLDWLLLTKRPQHIATMVPWAARWPENVWIGTTVENQKYADIRIPFLLQHNAAVRFVSVEPLLGPVDLSAWTRRDLRQRVDWVIVGGESGHGARPMAPSWAADLLSQCRERGVAFHFKQWGQWAPLQSHAHLPANVKRMSITADPGVEMASLGKTASGRILAGRTWNQIPRALADNQTTTRSRKSAENDKKHR